MSLASVPTGCLASPPWLLNLPVDRVRSRSDIRLAGVDVQLPTSFQDIPA